MPARIGGYVRHTVHGHKNVIPDPARGPNPLPIPGKQLVRVDVEGPLAIVGCDQLVSHGEGESGVGVDGHKVVSVKEAMGSSSGVIRPVEHQRLAERVEPRVIARGRSVSSWVEKIGQLGGGEQVGQWCCGLSDGMWVW